MYAKNILSAEIVLFIVFMFYKHNVFYQKILHQNVLLIAYIIYAISIVVFVKSSQSRAFLLMQGIFSVLKRKKVTAEQKIATRIIFLKAFFVPLMISWGYNTMIRIYENFSYIVKNPTPKCIFYFILNIILFIDLFFFGIGYILEHKVLKNEIKSVDNSFKGWFFVLICYPPLNNIIPWYSKAYYQYDNLILMIALNGMFLFFMGIYCWASIALNFKASNLTHRGIVSKGPYKYIRHPAYLCKNIAWWIGIIPSVIIAKDWLHLIYIICVMVIWSLIYFFRAITEERHLESVNDEYMKYRDKVKCRFIPGIY